MSEDRRGDGGGAVAVIVIVLVLALGGLLLVGGGAFFSYRAAQMARLEAQVQMERAQAEMMAAQMQANLAKQKALEAVAAEMIAEKPSTETAAKATPASTKPEILLSIDAAGQYTLGGKQLSFEELKETLLAEHLEQGPDLLLIITAEPETPFKRISQAVEAAECASITRHRIQP